MHQAMHRPGDGDTTQKSAEQDKLEMYQAFQSWACSNYGDTSKTRTVNHRKYNRIVRILTGQEPAVSENSKFRFWVKAKGFRFGPAPADGTTAPEDQVLYVPAGIPGSQVHGEREYKRVAIVEDFFNIIYNVHVEMDGRGGKHAGQKRTYRAVADTYAYLPREAVTRFLMSCTDCQKRMHNALEHGLSLTNVHGTDDFPLPLTTAYLAKSRQWSDNFASMLPSSQCSREESMSSGESESSRDRSVPSVGTGEVAPSIPKENNNEDMPVVNGNGGVVSDVAPAEEEVKVPEVQNVPESAPAELAVCEKREENRGHPERKRRASDEMSVDSCTTKTSEGGEKEKDDEDDNDNDDEDDERIPMGQDFDPERLKAFNMFVRLFVDENLDRMVPISKQPKDKIQAILEACDRQFPEFHERARKRIRTYLKSCRRMRRTKDQNGWESMRPTPPHLTSAAAEGILAQACENESNNAKRMRMGLEPLPAAMNVNNSLATSTVAQTSTSATPPSQSQSAPSQSSGQTARQSPAPVTPHHDRQTALPGDFIRHNPPHAFRPPHELPSPFFSNGNGLFRPGFPGYQHPAHHHPGVIQHTPLTNPIQNGPTDLSMKKNQQSSKSQLNPSEVATIKQLIAGYRESAAFLYRSADELEQLLLQQN